MVQAMNHSNTKDFDDLLVSASGTWRVMLDPASTPRGKTSLPGELGLRSPATARSLLLAINRAASESETSVLALAKNGDPHSEVLKVRPAREKGYAIVSVESIEADQKLLDMDMLVRLFELTRTEAEIAVSMLVTDELRDIATVRGVGIEAIRMHVKSLLRKTGMTSQKRLTALLTTLAMLASPAGKRGRAT